MSNFYIETSNVTEGSVEMLIDQNRNNFIKIEEQNGNVFIHFDFGESLNLRAVVVYPKDTFNRKDNNTMILRLGWDKTLTKTEEVFKREPSLTVSKTSLHWYHFFEDTIGQYLVIEKEQSALSVREVFIYFQDMPRKSNNSGDPDGIWQLNYSLVFITSFRINFALKRLLRNVFVQQR